VVVAVAAGVWKSPPAYICRQQLKARGLGELSFVKQIAKIPGLDHVFPAQ
jgi:hypothetical protein